MVKNSATWGRETAKKRYDTGGTVKPLEIQPQPEAPKEMGPIERLGVNTYRRELGRDPKTKRFGVNPYKARGGKVR
jgi:hypothetical protein